MNFWIDILLASVCVSALLTGLIIPQILVIAFRCKLFDDVDERKVHKGVVPRLGGLAFLPVSICSISLLVAFCLRYETAGEMAAALYPVIDKILFLVCALTLLFLIGLADDLIGVRYRAKFAIQITCACLMLLSGLGFESLYDLFGIMTIPDAFGWIVTGFMVVYIINAINLIDGIDGLASGLGSLALMFYGWVLYLEGLYIYSLVAWATFGILLVFFYYNVFGKAKKRTKIFMGDTGSLTIGMTIAFLALVLSSSPRTGNIAEFNPLLLAFSPLIIPLFDVARVCLHRLRNHRSPFMPDRSHIHHKLLAVGMSPAGALAAILCWSILYTLVNLLVSTVVSITWIVLADIAVYILVNMWLTMKIHVRERATGEKLYY